MIAPVMVTADRSPEPDTLADTLGSIEASSPGMLSALILCRDPERNANENVAAALRAGAATNPEWILFLEDDIAVCADFLGSVERWLDDYADAAYRVYPLCSAYQMPTLGAAEYPIARFYGTQAFVIRPGDALDLAAYLLEHCYDRAENGSQYDLLMADWSQERYPEQKNYLTPNPSFVQHTGTSSTINPRADIHRYPSFPGSDWSYAEKHREAV